jgi:hypothetical protein
MLRCRHLFRAVGAGALRHHISRSLALSLSHSRVVSESTFTAWKVAPGGPIVTTSPCNNPSHPTGRPNTPAPLHRWHPAVPTPSQRSKLLTPNRLTQQCRRCHAKGAPRDCIPGHLFVGTIEWTVAAIGSVSLALCLAISLKGAGFFAKFNVVFFAIQMLATAWGIVSFLVPQTNIDPHGSTVYVRLRLLLTSCFLFSFVLFSSVVFFLVQTRYMKY